MSKETAFFSRYKNYRTIIKRTTTQMIDGEMQTVPAVMAKFSGGFFKTEDEKTIKVLEKDPNVVKVGDAEIKKIRQGKLQFKGNMGLSEVSTNPDEEAKKAGERADKAEKAARDLAAENAKLKQDLKKAEEGPDVSKLKDENDKLKEALAKAQEAIKKEKQKNKDL